MLLKGMQNFLFVVGLIVAGPAAMAQSFRYLSYTTHEGLPVNNVYAAAQNNKGILWVGTDFGVSRFDGYRFVNYYQDNGLANKAVTDILYAGGDSCVLASYPDALQSVHDDGRIVTLVPKSQTHVQQLVKQDGKIYFYQRGSNVAGVWEANQCRYLLLDSLFGVNGILLRSIFKVSSSALGFCTNKGLFILSEKKTRQLLPNRDVLFALPNPRKTITAVADDALLESDEAFNFRPAAISLPPKLFITHALYTAAGDLWLRGMAEGVYRIHDNHLEEMSGAMNLQNKSVNKFFGDADGNSWFCTDGAGLLLHPETAFENFNRQNNLPNDKVTALLKKGDVFYIGTTDGLCRMSNWTISPIPLPRNGVGLQYVHDLISLQDGAVGICMAKTFPYSTAANDVSSVMLHQTIDHTPFISFHNFTAWQQGNTYWAMNDIYLTKIEHDTIAAIYDISTVGGRKGYSINYFDNRLWLGTDKGIVYLENGKLSKTDSIDGVFTGQVFQFLPAGHDTILIATEKGLAAKTKNGMHFMVRDKNDYAGSYCCAIAPDPEGGLWCATWNGLMYYRNGQIKRYGTGQGLASRICNTILYDPGSDRLLIGTDNGLSVIERKKLSPVTTAETVSIAASLNDSILVTDGMELPKGESGLRFYLNFPYYPDINEVVYEYRYDLTKWTRTTSPYVYLSGIGGGKHTLYARALINGEVVTSRETSFHFGITAPFYKTTWFWLLSALLLQLVIFLLISRRNARIRERKLAQQRRETEYASLKQQAFTQLLNPHFIFNALNSIQHYINKQDRQSVNKYLSDFARLIRKSFEAAQKSQATLGEELDAIRLYLQLERMRFAGKFDYSIEIDEELDESEWQLPTMMLQPFLENAVLHGLATLKSGGLITINARATGQSLEIVITDNGIGIENSKQLRIGMPHQSRGMQLIRERINLLSQLSKEPVQFTITEKSPGTSHPGTVVTLVFPQQIFQ